MTDLAKSGDVWRPAGVEDVTGHGEQSEREIWKFEAVVRRPVHESDVAPHSLIVRLNQEPLQNVNKLAHQSVVKS